MRSRSRKHSRARGRSRKTTVRPRSPIMTRSVTKRMRETRKKTPKLRMKSYVYIINDAGGNEFRVGQLIAESRNGKNVAVRLNYNGQLIILRKSEVRAATPQEKKRDPKAHRREPAINADERVRLNASPLF